MSKAAFKIAVFALAAASVFYLVKKASAGGANPDMGGVDFGTNGAFSQDTWQSDFGVQGGW